MRGSCTFFFFFKFCSFVRKSFESIYFLSGEIAHGTHPHTLYKQKQQTKQTTAQTNKNHTHTHTHKTHARARTRTHTHTHAHSRTYTCTHDTLVL